MIQALATAIEKDPFKMHDGARYLRQWVVESQHLHPALDVSIISQLHWSQLLAKSVLNEVVLEIQIKIKLP